MTTSAAFDAVGRLRRRERSVGYWIATDNPVGTERIARLGYDYVGIDAQHGLLDYRGWLAALLAIEAGGRSAGLVRVPANDLTFIGQALDAGAHGVIVPLVDSAEQAAAAVRACRYPPEGGRSYGPMRAGLRIGPAPAEANAHVFCAVMIETLTALENVEAIAATPGLDGVYVGPSDLTLALGGASSTDPAVADQLDTAAGRVAAAASARGIAAGIHCPDGATAHRRLAQGFTFATVSSDLVHLEQAAAAHLAAARN
ncbi:HpcH/HpaI aldolase family protein [Jiangella alba]|uniref:4-hydroxy-2-oxoheptanedioate aldolase n=1 Tax=Jiangella alba TaxID=561176 RepID=A0A1H5IXI8_9ACTN|nr:aldolase/citrate lyase family protein [Jiangella alba]SEE44108.1 4-hydroxy-2-oxoheptanedioate aldolase [Jiangella alba]